MKINRKIVEAVAFNLAETALIFLSGLAFKLDINYIWLLLMVFIIGRSCFGQPLHFKSWYRCLIWSLLIMTSLFVILKVDFVISVLFAIFSAFIMTGRSNIAEIYLWKNNGEPSKYQDILEYVKYHSFDDKLMEFEDKIKTKDTLEYLIYKYKFKDGKTFSEISELLEMDNPRIVEHLDRIAFAMRVYCSI